jgi:hypothetical protein
LKKRQPDHKLQLAREELEMYKSWIMPLNAKIDRAIGNVNGEMKLNMQLLEAHDNHCHYRKWAETELDQAHGVIRR